MESSREEERRIREIVTSLSGVSSPINHGRISWDRRDTKDLQLIIKSLGKLKLFHQMVTCFKNRSPFYHLNKKYLITLFFFSDGGKFFELLQQNVNVKNTKHVLLNLYWNWAHHELNFHTMSRGFYATIAQMKGKWKM